VFPSKRRPPIVRKALTGGVIPLVETTKVILGLRVLIGGVIPRDETTKVILGLRVLIGGATAQEETVLSSRTARNVSIRV